MEKEMEKEKNIISKLKFEGEYLNGKRWNGKGFNIKMKKYMKLKMGKEKEKNIMIILH